MNWVRKTAAKFDQMAFEAITVSRHTDGSLYVVEGQHRVLLAESLGMATIEAHVHDDLTIEQEATMEGLYYDVLVAEYSWKPVSV